MKHRFARTITAVVCTASIVVGALASSATGSPIDDKKRQAAALQAQIDANDRALVTLSERFNGATLHYNEAQAGINEAQRRTDAAEADRRRVRSILSRRAAQMYTGAGSASPLSALDAKSISEIATRTRYASAAADRDNSLMAGLQKASEALAARKADLERQRTAAQAETDAANAARAKIVSLNRQAQALQGQVKGEIATILQQQAAARVAAARRATAQPAPTRPARGGGGHSSIPSNFPNVPAPNAGAAAAVAFAKAQVGKGYRFATYGPDTFDCSGLTAMAWQAGGVSIAHYSGAQYEQTMRIGFGDLQPGDLIFHGPGGSDHVEIYVGAGMVVSASNPSVGVVFVPVAYNGAATGYGRVRA